MPNLLENFALAHTQVTRLHAELTEIVPADQAFSAKVELKLTPREMKSTQPGLPQYQVSARLLCRGTRAQDEGGEPLFTVEFIVQAVYRQFRGDPVPFDEFTQAHASLTRQLYPLIHHLLQPVLKQFGLDQLRLPHDLVEAGDDSAQRPAMH